MALNLSRMLERCRAGQWSVDDFDWSVPSIELGRFDEIEACHQFTNLVFIERIAALAFLELSRNTTDPLEKAIFESFHEDEVRHAEAMNRLAMHFNRHDYRIYAPNATLVFFVREMSKMIKGISPEFASAMVTGGELILDVALLRSVNDYLEDPLSRAVIEKINQDESRHIAMDFYLCEKYADAEARPVSAADFLRTMRDPTLVKGMAWATLALTDLFGRVAAIMDPSNRRFTEAIRRYTQLGERNPRIAKNPSYRAVARLNENVQRTLTEVGRVTKLLRVGIYAEIDRAEARGEKRQYADAGGSDHVVASAVDMVAGF